MNIFSRFYERISKVFSALDDPPEVQHMRAAIQKNLALTDFQVRVNETLTETLDRVNKRHARRTKQT